MKAFIRFIQKERIAKSIFLFYHIFSFYSLFSENNNHIRKQKKIRNKDTLPLSIRQCICFIRSISFCGFIRFESGDCQPSQISSFLSSIVFEIRYIIKAVTPYTRIFARGLSISSTNIQSRSKRLYPP